MNNPVTKQRSNKKTSGSRGVFRPKNVAKLLCKSLPGQVVIQLTDRCNASCPQCGMRKTEMFQRNNLSSKTVEGIIDHAAENGFQALSITGGEPLIYFDDVINFINYADSAGIEFIRTGTNGFLFCNSDAPDFTDRIKLIAEKLAATSIYTFWISIDSADASLHEEMRGLKSVIKGIKKALPIFHSYGIYPSANLGINRNTGGRNMMPLVSPGDTKGLTEAAYDSFRESFRNFYNSVINLGFTIVNSCYPMSSDETCSSEDLNAVYSAVSSDSIISFSKYEKIGIFRALYDTIPEYRSRIRIFTPRSSLLSLISEHSDKPSFTYPCRGGIDFFFINARDGMTYPCGYRGDENMGDFSNLDFRHIDRKQECRKCDWECFRDPSFLLGPLIKPLSFMNYFSNPEFFKTWKEDIDYYKACNYFNGRIPPDEKKMLKFRFGGNN